MGLYLGSQFYFIGLYLFTDIILPLATLALKYVFQLGSMRSSALFCFFKISWLFRTLCSFHVNFTNVLSVSANNAAGILIEIEFTV